MKKLVWALTAALLCTGCGAGAPAAAQPDTTTTAAAAETAAVPASSGAETVPETTAAVPEVPEKLLPGDYTEAYSITVPGGEFHLNASGRLLQESEKMQAIKDIFTDETLYYARRSYRYTDEQRTESQVYTDLYDPAGNILLQDYPRLITAAVGDYVQTAAYQPYFGEGQPDCCLLNPVTGEALLEGVYALQNVDGVRAMASDCNYNFRYLVDRNCRITEGIEGLNGDMLLPVHGYILRMDSILEQDECLLNTDGEIVMMLGDGSRLADANVFGDYIAIQKSDAAGPTEYILYRASDLSECCRGLGHLVYTDGTMCITGDEESGFLLRSGETGSQSAVYDEIRLDSYDKPCACFYGVRSGTEIRIELLDRDAAVRGCFTVPVRSEASWMGVGVERVGSHYVYEIYGDLGKSEYGLLDENFEKCADFEDLGYDLAYKYWGTEDVILGVRSGSGMNSSYDLMHGDGTVFFRGANQVGSGDEKGIAVMKGPNVGLIDTEGSWISKNSVYACSYMD